MARRARALVAFRVNGAPVAPGDVVLLDEADFLTLARMRKAGSAYVEAAPEEVSKIAAVDEEPPSRPRRRRAILGMRETAVDD